MKRGSYFLTLMKGLITVIVFFTFLNTGLAQMPSMNFRSSDCDAQSCSLQVVQCNLPASCDELFCNGDFEQFSPVGSRYYCQAGLPCWNGQAPYLTGSLDNVTNTNDDNTLVGMIYNLGIDYVETFYGELTESIPDGCMINICFDVAVELPEQGLTIFGANGLPCHDNSFDGVCSPGVINDPLCTGPDFNYFCLEEIPGNTIQSGAFVNNVGPHPDGFQLFTDFNNPMSQICIEKINDSGFPMEYLIIAQVPDISNAGSTFLDNISVNSCTDDCYFPTCECPDGGIQVGEGIQVGNGGNVTIGDSNLPDDEYKDGCVSINGTLVIDESYDFTNVHFIMNPGSRILITDYNVRVNIRGSLLEACTEMWQGIRIENFGQLNFEENTIRDAIHAINPTDDTHLHVADNDFIENFIGIYTDRNNGNIQFINDLDEPLLYNNRFSSPNTLKIPHTGEVSFAAVELNDTQQFNVGDLEELPNEITESSYGVRFRNTSFCDIVNNAIHDLPRSTGTIGTAIYMNEAILMDIEENELVNVSNGISAGGSQMEIENNLIQTYEPGNYIGVGIESHAGFDTEIEENIIRAGNAIIISAPIALGGNTPDFHVHDNEEISGSSIGINLLFSNGATILVEDNVINFLGVGIFANSWNGEALIFKNSIDHDASLFGNPNSTAGIWLSNTSGIHVVDNDINMAVSLANTQSGIFCNNNTANYFCCNNIDKTTFGVYFFGTDANTQFKTTTFGNHTVPLKYRNSFTGNQPGHGNNWESSNNTFHAQYQGDPFWMLSSIYFSDLSLRPGIDKIDVPLPYGEIDWFKPNGDDEECSIEYPGNNEIEACGRVIENGFGSPPPESLSPIDIKIAEGFQISSAEGLGIQFEAQRHLYQKLRNNIDLIAEHSSITAFYNAAQQNNLSEFYELDVEIASLADFYEFSNTAINDQLTVLKGEKENLKNLLLERSTATTAQLPAILAQIQNSRDNISILSVALQEDLDAFKNVVENSVVDLQAENAAINAFALYEINQQIFNAIYLDLLIQDRFTLSGAQQSDLEDLAYQCFTAGGRAVLQGRALLKLNGTNNDYTSMDENCEEEPQERLFNETTKILEQLRIYPNPTNGAFTILLGKAVADEIDFRILNAMGKIILYDQMTQGEQKTEVSLENYLPGIYYIELKGLDGEYVTHKIVFLPND